MICLAFLLAFIRPSIQESFVFSNSNLDSGLDESIKRAEQRLDGFLNKELENADSSWRPHSLNSQRYYFQQYSVSVRGQKLRVDSARIVSSSNLRQMVLNLEVHARGVITEGMITARRLLYHVYGYTSRTNDLTCKGTASINKTNEGLTLDWLFVDCPEDTGISTQVSQMVSTLRSLDSTASGLVPELESRIVEEYSSAMTALCSDSVKRALEKTRGILGELEMNQPYAQLVKKEEDSSNDLLDYLLILVASKIRLKFNDTIPLPDIVEGSRILRRVHLDTGLSASHGTARNISSLKRAGNARVVQDNVTIQFAGRLKFSLVRIHYDEFGASILGVGPNGNLDVGVQDAIVALKMTIDLGNTRRIFLDQLHITDTGKIDVNIGGFGRVLGTVISEVSELVVTFLKQMIMRIVEQRVIDFGRKALAKNTIDQIITGNITL